MIGFSHVCFERPLLVFRRQRERQGERQRETKRGRERQRQKDRASFSAIRTGMSSFSRIACLMKFIRALLMVLLQFSQFVFG